MTEAGADRGGLFAADVWLAETLGKPVYKLAAALGGRDACEVGAEVLRLTAGVPAFFYAKSSTCDVAAAATLTRAGFAVVDTAITFAWRAGGRTPRETGSVADVRPHQHEAVAAIAESAFRWSRFHLDPDVSTAQANLIKRRWIENYLRGHRGSALYVADVAGEVAGFLAVLEAQVAGRSFAVIDLIAVAPKFQGRGVGGMLVDTFIEGWRDRVDELRVGTQAANIGSLRFYEQMGFRVSESSYVLHAHPAAEAGSQ